MIALPDGLYDPLIDARLAALVEALRERGAASVEALPAA